MEGKIDGKDRAKVTKWVKQKLREKGLKDISARWDVGTGFKWFIITKKDFCRFTGEENEKLGSFFNIIPVGLNCLAFRYEEMLSLMEGI